jgi:TonB family protein
VTAAAGDFEAARRRELGRLFALSCVAHAGLFGLLAASWPARHGDLPAVISVDLVGAVPRVAPAPAPARPAPPAPAPAAQPKPPPPPKPAKVVLPKDPVKQPARKEKAPEKARPEARPEPRPKPEPPPEDLEDVLAELRAEAGEKRPEAEPEPLAAAEPGPPGPSGGALVSPEVAAWVRLAKLHVRRAWIVPPGFRTQSLVATLEVELDAGGRVVGEPDVVRPSGNPWYDEGVVRALQKASPLPPPPEAGRWSFAFDSSEAL